MQDFCDICLFLALKLKGVSNIFAHFYNLSLYLHISGLPGFCQQNGSSLMDTLYFHPSTLP